MIAPVALEIGMERSARAQALCAGKPVDAPEVIDANAMIQIWESIVEWAEAGDAGRIHVMNAAPAARACDQARKVARAAFDTLRANPGLPAAQQLEARIDLARQLARAADRWPGGGGLTARLDASLTVGCAA